MDIKAQIQKDRLAAMKSGESDKKAVLDYILGEIQKKEKDANPKPDQETGIITAYLKSLREFIDQHGTTRPEEAAKYSREIEILSAYLPKQLTDDEIKSEVAALQAGGETKRGMIMKALKEKHGAALDGRRANQILGELGIQ